MRPALPTSVRPAFPTSEYYDPLRLPLDRPLHFPGSPVIGGASLPATPPATGPRRLSRVPRTTIRSFNAQHAGGFLSARSWTKSAFRGLRRGRTGSAPSLPRLGADSVTTLVRASPALQTARSIAPRFARGLSTTHGGFTTGDPGVSPDRTHTGRPPRTCRSYVMWSSLTSRRRSSPGAPVQLESDSVHLDVQR
jgi:hypothetical protein